MPAAARAPQPDVRARLRVEVPGGVPGDAVAHLDEAGALPVEAAGNRASTQLGGDTTRNGTSWIEDDEATLRRIMAQQ